MATETNRAMDPEKFAKVLAMAESDHHGEAQSALRAARIMLARAGMTFRDLAAMAKVPDQAAFVPTNVPGAGEDTWRRKVRELEARIRELENTVETQDTELIRQRGETKRWHLLARETAEKLWDVGQALETKRVRADVATDRRKQLIEALRDPAAEVETGHLRPDRPRPGPRQDDSDDDERSPHDSPCSRDPAAGPGMRLILDTSGAATQGECRAPETPGPAAVFCSPICDHPA